MPLANEIINDLIGIKESYELPSKLLPILLDEDEKEKLFDGFIDHEKDLSFDWFVDYFQEEHGDRGKLKQDFTPYGICELADAITGKGEVIADICAGTGGLTIKKWNSNPDAEFYCEELSTRTAPMLLFNLAIRNITATIVNGDSLTAENTAIYKLTKSEKYSDIEVIHKAEITNVNIVVSNPPYSIKWNSKEFKGDKRFEGFGLAPNGKADYAFVLHGLNKLADNGKMIAILPHGVLFRGGTEDEIRRNLIDNNLIDAIIGLPAKLFLNTQIPVFLLVLKKGREKKDILFIDASSECKELAKQNELEQEHIDKIVTAYKNRWEIERYSHLADIEEIKENDYNLNIPRFVDTYIPEPVPDLRNCLKEYIELDKEIQKVNGELIEMLQDLVGTDEDSDKELVEAREMLVNYENSKNITLAKDNKGNYTQLRLPF